MISINQKVEQIILHHAAEAYPNECCGFFYGKDGEPRLVIEALQVDNSKEGDQRRRFEVSPKDYMKAERYALEQELDLLGVYHSHPDHPAVPSEHDLKQALPNFSYIIVSVEKGEPVALKSWRLKEGERTFEEENITLNKKQNS